VASATVINSGFFKLDGGAMFGVVPKQLWVKQNPADDNNMCTWAMRCLLVDEGDRKILIDTGIGHKQSDKFKSHFSPKNIIDFEQDLDQYNLSHEDITDVLLTHLHFDHAGGALSMDKKGNIIPAFPNARVWTNDYHYKWATEPNERERASFLKENILPLADLQLLHFTELGNEVRFSRTITLDYVYGHTGAMMIPTIELGSGKKIIFCADLLPSSFHVGLPYVMAYDVQPLLTLKEKEELYEKACNDDTFLFTEHDPLTNYIRIEKNEQGRVVLRDRMDFID